MVEQHILRLAKSMFEFLKQNQSSKKSEIIEALNITEREFDKIRGLLHRKKLITRRWVELEDDSLTPIYEIPKDMMHFHRFTPQEFFMEE